MTPTPAQLNYLRKLDRAGGQISVPKKTWDFIDRMQIAGLVEIIDPGRRFPYTWEATRITAAGRAALAGAN